MAVGNLSGDALHQVVAEPAGAGDSVFRSPPPPLTRSEITRFNRFPKTLDETLLYGGCPSIFDRKLEQREWLRSDVATCLDRDVRTVSHSETSPRLSASLNSVRVESHDSSIMRISRGFGNLATDAEGLAEYPRNELYRVWLAVVPFESSQASREVEFRISRASSKHPKPASEWASSLQRRASAQAMNDPKSLIF